MSSPQSRDHAWLPRASCDAECLRAGGSETSRRVMVALRVARRITLALLLAPALTVLAVVLPGWSKARQVYCRLLLWCLGVRITLSGGPIRNLPGVLVVSDHMSWLDILTIGAVLAVLCVALLFAFGRQAPSTNGDFVGVDPPRLDHYWPAKNNFLRGSTRWRAKRSLARCSAGPHTARITAKPRPGFRPSQLTK